MAHIFWVEVKKKILFFLLDTKTHNNFFYLHRLFSVCSRRCPSPMATDGDGDDDGQRWRWRWTEMAMPTDGDGDDDGNGRRARRTETAMTMATDGDGDGRRWQ